MKESYALSLTFLDVELMPPSKFETSTTPDPWKELAAATNEIMCLRQQVDQHK